MTSELIDSYLTAHKTRIMSVIANLFIDGKINYTEFKDLQSSVESFSALLTLEINSLIKKNKERE